MHHQDRACRAEFDGKIAVRDRIEGVASHPAKAEEFSNILAVDGEGRPRQGPGAEGEVIEPRGAVGKAPGVAFEHLVISEHVVAKEDRLGRLQMSEAGHDRVKIGLGLGEKGFLQLVEIAQHRCHFIAQIEADIKGDLIVARTGGVQLAADRSDALGESRFDIHVNIFKADLEFEVAGVDISQNAFQPGNNDCRLLVADDRLLRQHLAVGDGARNIITVHALVEVDRSGEFFNEFVGRLVEAAAPEFVLTHNSP